MNPERRGTGVGFRGVVVGPGEVALVRDGPPLVAVVSVGVAVCLWSPDRSACMAHFVEPAVEDPRLATCRYGNVAVRQALEWMTESAHARSLEAQVVGGAFRPGLESRARANVELARRILASRGVSLVSQDVGGTVGRKIVLDPATGQVAIVKVRSLRKEDWHP